MDAIIGLLLRHVATGLGAVLVTRNLADPTSAEAIVGGLVTAGGLAWSWWQKKKSGVL